MTSAPRLFQGAVCAMFLGGWAHSQDQDLVEDQTNLALSAFHGFCLNSMFDLEGAENLAERFGREEISAEDLQVFVPEIEAEIESCRGYLALSPDDPPLPIAVFVGESVDPDGRTEHCSMFFDDVLPAEFTDAFILDADARKAHEESRVAATTSFHEVPEFPGDLVLLESQARSRGLRATFLMRQEPE